MATTYRLCSLVTVVDIGIVEMIVIIVLGQRAGRRRRQSTLFSWRTAAT